MLMLKSVVFLWNSVLGNSVQGVLDRNSSQLNIMCLPAGSHVKCLFIKKLKQLFLSYNALHSLHQCLAITVKACTVAHHVYTHTDNSG